MSVPLPYIMGFVLSIGVVSILQYRMSTHYGVSPVWKLLGCIAIAQLSLVSVHITGIIFPTATLWLTVTVAIPIAVIAIFSGVLSGHVSAKLETKYTNSNVH